MADIKIPIPDTSRDDDRGDDRERGKRGKRGHDGPTGPTGSGSTGSTGPTGPTGSTGPTGTGTGSTGPTGPTGSGSTGPTGATGPASGGSTILAVASINGADGTAFANTGFSATARLSAGSYLLTLGGTPPPDAKVVPVVTVLSPSAVVIGIATVGAGAIAVHTSQDPTGGVKTDASFYIIVSQGA
jgi:hypothetical protein